MVFSPANIAYLMASAQRIAILQLLVIMACRESPDSNTDYQPLPLTDKLFSYVSQPCPDKKGGCIEVYIRVPQVSGQNASSPLNQQLLQRMAEVLEEWNPRVEQLDDIHTVVKSFQREHSLYGNETGTSPYWSLKVDYKILRNNRESLIVLFQTDRFTGGAHPSSAVSILNLNSVDGTALKLVDIIKSPQELMALIYNHIRKTRNLTPGTSLTQLGYFSDEWPLPEHFARLPEGLYVVYNPYEIGPYVLGPTELLIPSNQLKSILKD